MCSLCQLGPFLLAQSQFHDKVDVTQTQNTKLTWHWEHAHILVQVMNLLVPIN